MGVMVGESASVGAHLLTALRQSVSVGTVPGKQQGRISWKQAATFLLWALLLFLQGVTDLLVSQRCECFLCVKWDL